MATGKAKAAIDKAKATKAKKEPGKKAGAMVAAKKREKQKYKLK